MRNNSIPNSELVNNEDVKHRLLDAAEKLFCDKGFAATSVRDITKQAKCNLASVNYYFKGKDDLYIEVFRQHFSVLRNVRIEAINKVMENENATLEDLLRGFAHAFLEPLLDKSSGRRLMKLITREMFNPVLDQMVFADEVITPILKVFGKALTRIQPAVKEKNIIMCLGSIVGQLLHIVNHNEMFEGKKEISTHIFSLDEAIEHVVRFSAAGIRAVAAGENK